MARYLEIAAELRRRVRTGAYSLNTTLPVRAELSQEFDVARATLDRSIQVLANEGLLSSRRGSGTVVARDAVAFPVAVVGGYGVEPMVRHPALELTLLDPACLVHRSDRGQLDRFEGLIWHLPTPEILNWAYEWQGKLPQIVVNRDVAGLEYISTDHRGAIQRLVSRRLAEHPDALPVYLAMRGEQPMVDELRQEGFVSACRKVRRYHEVLPLDPEFDKKIEALDRIHSWRKKKESQPLLLVSGSFLHTGAVMAWRMRHELRWRSDLWYSDFDDTYPSNVWGVRVTSFVQDYRLLCQHALDRLVARLQGDPGPVRELIEPVFVKGET